LSCSVSGHEQTDVDTFTFRHGALVPNDNLKKLRQETIGFLATLFRTTRDEAKRCSIVQVMLSLLERPNTINYSDELVKMLFEDSKTLFALLKSLLFSNDGNVANYAIAQEVEDTLLFLLRNEEFVSEEAQELKTKLYADQAYMNYCTLVGDIYSSRFIETSWDEIQNRRKDDLNALVESITSESQEEWYTQLNNFVSFIEKTILDPSKYWSLRQFLFRITSEKPEVSKYFFQKA